MKARDFCYWLQGYFELAADGNRNEHGQAVAPGINGLQAQTIQNHLAMVFKHEIDPSNGTPEHNKELNKLHSKIPGDFLSGGIDAKLNC